MRCEQCQAADAVYHLMRITENVSETLHLCTECAERRGLMASLGETVVPSGSLEAPDEPIPDVADLFQATTCLGCGMTLALLQENWRVGCALCWTTFEDALRVAVRQIHGAATHVGKVHSGEPVWVPGPAAIVRMERARIERDLQDAVVEERFEEAALLRDALRGMAE